MLGSIHGEQYDINIINYDVYRKEGAVKRQYASIDELFFGEKKSKIRGRKFYRPFTRDPQEDTRYNCVRMKTDPKFSGLLNP